MLGLILRVKVALVEAGGSSGAVVESGACCDADREVDVDMLYASEREMGLPEYGDVEELTAG